MRLNTHDGDENDKDNPVRLKTSQSLDLMSHEATYLETKDMYNIFKEEYNKKMEYRALRLLDISQSNKNSSVKGKNKCKIPRPIIQNNKYTLKISLKDSYDSKNSQISENHTLITKKTRSLSKKNLGKSSESLLSLSLSPAHERSDYNLLDVKISSEAILNLRARFFGKEKLTKGEIVEMMYGKAIPSIKLKDTKYLGTYENYSEDYQKKVDEVLSNQPGLLLNLIENGEVTEKEVWDYFNFQSLSIIWNENLEKIYREIVYNKNKTNSNVLKTTYFLINIGFHKILKEKFEQRHLVDVNSLVPSEIEEMATIYEKIKRTPLRVIRNACLKLETIFHKKDELVHHLITQARNKFYETNVKKFREIRRKEDEFVKTANNLAEQKIQSVKNFLSNFRTNIKRSTLKTSDNLSSKNQVRNFYQRCHIKQDIYNIVQISKLKSSKCYIKALVQFFKKANRLPNEKKSFNWRDFSTESKESKKVVNYYASLIQSAMKGHMIRKWIDRMYVANARIKRNILRYASYKKQVMKLYKRVIEEINPEILRTNAGVYKDKIREIRALINALYFHYADCSFFLFLSNKDVIRKFSRKFFSREQTIPNIIKSRKLLIFLDNCLVKLSSICSD